MFVKIGCAFVVVLQSSVVPNSVISRTAAWQGCLCFSVSWSLHKLMFIELIMPSNHLILCHSCLLWPSVFPSIRVFSSEWALCIRWSKYWSFSFSINSFNEYLVLTGLISLLSKGLWVFSCTTVWKQRPLGSLMWQNTLIPFVRVTKESVSVLRGNIQSLIM